MDAGRTVVCNNFYTIVKLANKLLNRKTHLVGTLRSNRRENPKEVITKKQKKRNVWFSIRKRTSAIKWHDKRDVLLLSTSHTDETTDVPRQIEVVKKPTAIINYNSNKSSIDIFDQIFSYSTALRCSVKYKKVANKLILGTSVVNAHFVYKEITYNYYRVQRKRS